jgi:spermidine synthase
MGLWFDETFQERVRLGLRVKRSLLHVRSEYQTIDIVDTEPYGITLLLDNAYMTSVGEEYYYHELLVHPAFTSAPAIERVLVIGGGDGGTVREVLRYREVEQVTMCELDRMVTEACQQHMQAFNVPWDDPRLTLRFGDGVAYLSEYAGEPFDVILIDGSDPVGPAEGLITGSFYESCRRCLKPTGVLALQSEAPHLMREDFLRIVNTLRGVFPRVHPYFGPVPIYPSGCWSWTVASSSVDPLTPRADRLAQIETTCRYYNRDIHHAAFAQPNDIRLALAATR